MKQKSPLQAAAGTGRRQTTPARGYLLIDLESAATDKRGLQRARILSLSLLEASGAAAELTSNRDIQINLGQAQTLGFRVSAPAGEYRALRLRVAEVDLPQGKPWPAAEHSFPLLLTVRPETTTRIALRFDAQALLAGQSLGEVIQAVVAVPEKGPEFRSAAGKATMMRWPATEPGIEEAQLPSVRIPPDALPDNTRVVIREAPGDGLPPLFKRQRRVGPVIAVEAEAPLQRPVEVSVPYDEALAGQAGARPEELIVMRLDAARDRYYELRPVRIDKRNRTLSVRTAAMSEFFACTPGILIQIPALFATRWELAGVVAGDATTIAGRVEDEAAVVSLIRPTAPAGWSQFGWFEFQNVPLGGPSTQAEIEARAPGLAAHTCSFTLRREPPPKRVDLTNRLYRPALQVSADDRAVVSAVLNHQRLSEEGLVEGVSDWQRRYVRPEPFVYLPGQGASFWRRTALLPEIFFENEVARQVVEAARLTVNNAAPEATRYLVSIADFLRTLAESDPRRATVNMLLETAAREFRDERLMLSPAAPVLAEDGEDFSVAFVAATLTSRRRAEANGMQAWISALHTHPRGDWDERPVVYAGNLYYARRAGGSLRRELVAEDIWCATLEMKRDPQSGQPVIAALAMADDANGQPRSALRLYRRGEDGRWQEGLVLDDQPIVDFDLAFGPDGSIRFVAVRPGREDRKWRLVFVRRQGGSWVSEPLFYRLVGRDKSYDGGACPRLHVESSGRTVVVFVSYLASGTVWMMAVEEGPPWLAARIQQAQYIDLVGSGLPPQEDAIIQFDQPVFHSGLSLVHWQPAITSDGEGGLWCAYGSGMLNLARLDLSALTAELFRLDVDRMIGFSPALALRRNGAPAIVYKDPFGFGQFGPGDQDEVHFLSLDDGNVTPLNEAFAPVLPPFGRGLLGVLRDFRPGQGRPPADPRLEVPPYIPLDCATIRDASQLNPLLFSVLANRKFHMDVYPAGGDYPRHLLNYTLSHPRLAAMIEGLPARPTMSIFVIDNSDAGEGIVRIDITQFNDPVGFIDTSFAVDLDQRNVTAEIRMAFRNQGLALSDASIEVSVLDAGNAWDLNDPSAFGLNGTPIAQTYRVRRRKEGLAIEVPAVVSVVDRADMRGADGRRQPCGMLQELWDIATAELVTRFTGFQIELPDDIPGQLRRVEIRDMHMTACEAWDPPNDQQGAVRFTFTIPRVAFRNSDPDATGWTTDPSILRVSLAPYVSDGTIRWWIREVEVGVSRFEVDVDVGAFSWLKWFSVIPGLGFLFLVADPFVDSWARSAVNKDFEEPDSGGIEHVLREALQGWFDRRLGEDRRGAEGVYMRNLELRVWRRDRLPAAPGSGLEIVPRAVNFGQNEAGSPLVRRNVLLVNNGNIPVLIEDVVLTRGAPDMAVESLRQWPSTIAPGDSLAIVLSYLPQGSPGFRDGELQVRVNGGRLNTVLLSANVLAPPVSPLRVVPRFIQFGIINAGQTADRQVEVFNDGPGITAINAARIEGPQAGAFELRNDPTGAILRGQSVPVRVRFRAPAGVGARYEARVVLDTSDARFPEVEIEATGFSIVAALLVTPASIQFNDSPIQANLPPLPPGLPPTVHLGSTRSFLIGNTGLPDLTVTAGSFRVLDAAGVVSPHYRLWDAQGAPLAAAPLTLRSGETFVVIVEFLPQTPGDHDAAVNVASNDPAQPVISVSISGRGLP